MIVAIWALNNITAYKLLTTCYGMSSDSYRHQTTNNFEKLLDLKDAENTSMITAPIFQILRMHIGPTRLLEDSAPNTEFSANRRFRTRSTGLNWYDNTKIEEAIAIDKDDEDKKEDPRGRNRWLKKEKQCQKRVAKVKTHLAKVITCQ